MALAAIGVFGLGVVSASISNANKLLTKTFDKATLKLTKTLTQGAVKMLNYENKGVTVTNTKTGNKGVVVCQYNRTNDGVAIVEVSIIGRAKTAHWRASNVEGV